VTPTGLLALVKGHHHDDGAEDPDGVWCHVLPDRANKLAQKHSALKPAVHAMAAALQLEQLSRRCFGSCITSSIVSWLAWARDLISSAQVKPAFVLTLPDGLIVPAAAAAAGAVWLGGESSVAEEELVGWVHTSTTDQGARLHNNPAAATAAAAAATMTIALPDQAGHSAVQAGAQRSGTAGTHTDEGSLASTAVRASSSSSSSSSTAGERQQQQQGSPAALLRGLWRVLGADKVDPDNLLITVMLGALAGVLFLRRRQQVLLLAGQRPATHPAATTAPPEAMQQQQQQQPATAEQAGPSTAAAATASESRAADDDLR
jgi:hypothetical protein